MSSENTKNIIKIIITSIICLILVGFSYIFLLKFYISEIIISINAENLISILLAFFSISISIAFYFKANDTSNKFYESSYEYMKEQSILLGRIEERFGEKLGNVQAILETLRPKQEESKEKLKEELNDITDIVHSLLENSQLPQNEKSKIIDTIKQKEKAMYEIQLNKEKEFNDILKDFKFANDDHFNKFFLNQNKSLISEEIVKQIPKEAIDKRNLKVDFSKMSEISKLKGIEAGIFSPKGYISAKGIGLFEKNE